ncbi:thioredoxin domain-containing protein 15-like [Rhopilema esculentum]|uniref:thioredoxin domain-containing protein 15-like n=1 Tax=Rhopilema esculentum TaxID=499914 RepID=UPI0031D5AC43
MADKYVLLAFFVALLTCKSFADNEEVAGAKNEINDAAKDFEKRFSDEIQKKKEQLESFINETSFLDGLNLTLGQEETDTQFNETEQTEEATKEKARWNCNLMSLFSSQEEQKVVLVKNDTQLSDVIAKSNESQSCFLLYFYVGWCEFCADFAAEINTVGRVYFGLPVLAVESYYLSSIAGKFGVTGVPTLILFYNGRPVAKFNRTRSLQGLEDFISHTTGLSSNISMRTDDKDFEGPLPTKIR